MFEKVRNFFWASEKEVEEGPFQKLVITKCEGGGWKLFWIIKDGTKFEATGSPHPFSSAYNAKEYGLKHFKKYAEQEKITTEKK